MWQQHLWQQSQVNASHLLVVGNRVAILERQIGAMHTQLMNSVPLPAFKQLHREVEELRQQLVSLNNRRLCNKPPYISPVSDCFFVLIQGSRMVEPATPEIKEASLKT